MTSERVRYIYRLKPGAGPDYDHAHENVPQALLDLIDRAGISNYTIWRHKEVVVCEFDAQLGFDHAQSILSSSTVQKEWTAQLSHLFEQIDENGEPLWLSEVFRLD